MIFAIIGEELGLVGGTLVIAAYAAFGWGGAAHRAALPRPVRARASPSGSRTLICGQAALTSPRRRGAPLTGIPLPLVSVGGDQPRGDARVGRHPP
jgi:cell division protein FtsW